MESVAANDSDGRISRWTPEDTVRSSERWERHGQCILDPGQRVVFASYAYRDRDNDSHDTFYVLVRASVLH